MTLLNFQFVLGRRYIRPPHFASKVSYSASPQAFADVRATALVAAPQPPCYLAQNRADIFLEFEHLPLLSVTP